MAPFSRNPQRFCHLQTAFLTLLQKVLDKLGGQQPAGKLWFVCQKGEGGTAQTAIFII